MGILRKVSDFIVTFFAAIYVFSLYAILFSILAAFILIVIMAFDWTPDQKLNFSIWQSPFIKDIMRWIDSL